MHVRPRPGHEHEPGTTPSISIDPPINAFTPMRATSRRRPARSSPRPTPPDGTGAFSASPELRTPRSLPRTSGRGRIIERGSETSALRHQPNLQHRLLDACDLVSHSWERTYGQSAFVPARPGWPSRLRHRPPKRRPGWATWSPRCSSGLTRACQRRHATLCKERPDVRSCDRLYRVTRGGKA